MLRVSELFIDFRGSFGQLNFMVTRRVINANFPHPDICSAGQYLKHSRSNPAKLLPKASFSAHNLREVHLGRLRKVSSRKTSTSVKLTAYSVCNLIKISLSCAFALSE